MNTSDYALIVSIFSALIAIASFVWNVWSKWLYPKAKVRVGFTPIVVHYGDGPAADQPHFLRMSMVNFGPTEVTLTTAVLQFKAERPWQRCQSAIVNPVSSIHTPHIAAGPFTGGLPKKLAVGETFDLFFPHDSDFARLRLKRLGIIDTFGRFHGAPRKDIRKSFDELVHQYGPSKRSRKTRPPTRRGRDG